MSNEPHRSTEFPSLDAWKGEFMRAAEAHPRSRLPGPRLHISNRLAVAVAVAIALPAGAGIAVAAGVAGDDSKVIDPPPLNVIDDGGPSARGVTPGAVVGYLDLETNELISCPGGEPLSRTFGELAPVCPDGSLPEKYREQQKEFDSWVQTAPVGTPVENGPNFQVILDGGD